MSDFATYSLGVVLRETGINPDTLRAWERRYNLPQPARSEGGQRLYSQRDIETIKWLLQRQAEGMRIGQAVKLWKSRVARGDDPLQQTASISLFSEEKMPDQRQLLSFTESWITACLSFNEAVAEQISDDILARFSPERAFLEIFIPAMRQIGELWYQGDATVQQEHFASALLARRLDALISALPAPTRPEKVIVGCPPKEEHTLALLLMTLYLRRRGFNVIYLGANIPLDQFAETANEIRPHLVILAAQLLTTAATLEETARILTQNDIPVAYSGRIFITTPELREKISGNFLGETLMEVFQEAERILKEGKISINTQKNMNEYDHLRENFVVYRPAVHVYLTTTLATWQAPLHLFSDANDFMSANILAALQLGDLDFLKPELDWARELLRKRALAHISIAEYWKAYAKAVKQAIGDEAAPIVNWLMAEAAR